MLDYLGYLLYGLGEALAMRTPTMWAYRLAELMAWLYWHFHRRSRAILLANLRQVLGGSAADEARVRRTARMGFRHFAYGVVDFFRLPRLLAEGLDQLISSVSGERHLREVLAAGQGAILMTAHIGPWEAGGAWLASQGIPITTVALSHRSPRVERFFVSRRERSGYRSVPLGRAARELLRALQRGEMIVLAADRNFTESGTWTEFFGRSALMPDGHVRIALRTGAPILPAFMLRLEDMRVRVFIEGPIILRKGQDDVVSGMQRCVRIMERYIGRWPEQWMAFSPVWPRAPGERRESVGQASSKEGGDVVKW